MRPDIRRRSLAMAALLALCSACSGSGSDGPPTSQSGAGSLCPNGSAPEAQCPAASEKPQGVALIDDLEDGDAFIPTSANRNGAWWTAGDATSGATLVPAPEGVAPPELIVGGRCDSKLAMRVTGQGFLDWGALLGVNLRYGDYGDGTEGAFPYDASSYTGIEFWARIGDTSTDRVRFAVSDVNNEPRGGVCKDNNQTGEQCYDTFGSYLNGLSPEWRHYRIAFKSLTQRQFGVPVSAAATNAIYSVQFNFDPTAVFDFWVDDLAFY